jgi:hypothetical protein
MPGWISRYVIGKVAAIICLYIALLPLLSLSYWQVYRWEYQNSSSETTPETIETYVFVLVIVFALALALLLWILFDYIISTFSYVSSALGYETQITDVEPYDIEKILSPLEQTKRRIGAHIVRLRNNAFVNLFIGILVAICGVGVIIGILASHAQDTSDGLKNQISFFSNFVFPRLTLSLFIQAVAYFFLAMYRANQNDIKYFTNEMTNIDSVSVAISIMNRNNSAQNTKLMLSTLAKTERNRTMKKSERAISDTNDEEIIGVLGRTVTLGADRDRAEKGTGGHRVKHKE